MIERKQVIDEKTGELISENEQHVAMNRDFVQFYRSQLHTVAELGRSDPLALAIWLWIVERMGRDNALVCSMAPIIEHFQKSRQTISKKIALLRTKGYLGVAKTGTTNIYIANAELVWTSNASKRRTAEFRARVVVAESEQSKAPYPFIKSASPISEENAPPSSGAKKAPPIRSRRVISSPALVVDAASVLAMKQGRRHALDAHAFSVEQQPPTRAVPASVVPLVPDIPSSSPTIAAAADHNVQPCG